MNFWNKPTDGRRIVDTTRPSRCTHGRWLSEPCGGCTAFFKNVNFNMQVTGSNVTTTTYGGQGGTGGNFTFERK